MKLLIISAVFFCSSVSFAQSFGQGYEGVNSVACEGENGTFNASVEEQTLTGVFTDGETTLSFSFEPLSQEEELDVEVGLIINLFESGYDLFGGVVVSDDFSTFGTLGVFLDKALGETLSEYEIVYIEAMTGTAISVPMMCSFE